MINPMNGSFAPLHTSSAHTEQPAPVRNKRSLEPFAEARDAVDYNGVSASDRGRKNSGGLDNLGGGRLP
ncbi:hypothetical protein [Pseudomonas sp. K2I15]|uniref:hypothetical protein n=1 Tax=unclassified Pseudomonas TaxID=196821 RepID=UPI000B4C5C3C|nr:hypothetical protein [Pseudomonas sp. K2I15]OWP71467.1 hypothetical protein CEC48_12995 [Pseudomonas sp. K2I15]